MEFTHLKGKQIGPTWEQLEFFLNQNVTDWTISDSHLFNIQYSNFIDDLHNRVCSLLLSRISVVIKIKPFKTRRHKTKTTAFKTWPLPTKLTQRLKDSRWVNFVGRGWERPIPSYQTYIRWHKMHNMLVKYSAWSTAQDLQCLCSHIVTLVQNE